MESRGQLCEFSLSIFMGSGGFTQITPLNYFTIPIFSFQAVAASQASLAPFFLACVCMPSLLLTLRFWVHCCGQCSSMETPWHCRVTIGSSSVRLDGCRISTLQGAFSSLDTSVPVWSCFLPTIALYVWQPCPPLPLTVLSYVFCWTAYSSATLEIHLCGSSMFSIAPSLISFTSLIIAPLPGWI